LRQIDGVCLRVIDLNYNKDTKMLHNKMYYLLVLLSYDLKYHWQVEAISHL